MDDRGFIFTADASLALIVLMIFSVSIAAYIMAPYFMGQDHQHLQALASDTLEIMEQDGTLSDAAVYYNQGNISEANKILNDRLSILIPQDTAYNLNMLGHNVDNSSRVLVATDRATAVRVISGPREGFMGRAWYKNEEVKFIDQQVNVTRTVWNFHNWLTNFYPWSGGLYYNQYWGYGSSPSNIPFSLPADAVFHNAYFLQGSSNQSATSRNDLSYGVTVNINGMNYQNSTPFTALYDRSNNYGWVYNYRGNITNLQAGSNNFYVKFNYLTGRNTYQGWQPYSYNMPWFSIIANYTTTIKVPEGILNLEDTKFPDAAGLAVYVNSNQANVTTYDLNTGTTNNYLANRVMNWNDYVNNRNTLDNYDDGIPFVIDNGYQDRGSAVSVIKEFNIPNHPPTDPTGPPPRIFDGYIDVNAYGAVDKALVEVWDSENTQWVTVFCSFDFDGIKYSAIAPYDNSPAGNNGYGNTPGTIYIGDKLHVGNNKVRITVWDNVPSNDYDLVGLVDSSVHVSYSFLPIKWDTYAFPSYQASAGQTATFGGDVNYPTNGQYFTIGPDATLLYLFVGASTTARGISVEVRNATNGWVQIYNSNSIPYMIDLASLDAGSGAHRFTSGTATNYTLHQGSGYRVRVTLTAPYAWQSGDGASNPSTYGNPAIFSGTRVAVIYPKFLENLWTTSYNNTAEAAKDQAKADLINILTQSGIYVNPDTILTEAIYTGNLPNAIPVRLDLWKE